MGGRCSPVPHGAHGVGAAGAARAARPVGLGGRWALRVLMGTAPGCGWGARCGGAARSGCLHPKFPTPAPGVAPGLRGTGVPKAATSPSPPYPATSSPRNFGTPPKSPPKTPQTHPNSPQPPSLTLPIPTSQPRWGPHPSAPLRGAVCVRVRGGGGKKKGGCAGAPDARGPADWPRGCPKFPVRSRAGCDGSHLSPPPHRI